MLQDQCGCGWAPAWCSDLGIQANGGYNSSRRTSSVLTGGESSTLHQELLVQQAWRRAAQISLQERTCSEVGWQLPALGTFWLCCRVQAEVKISLGGSQPNVVTRPVISAQPGVILTLTGNMKFLLALAKTFSEMCHSQSFFLPSSPSVSLFLFPSWVSDLQCSLKTFPAYLWSLSPIYFKHYP